jgi:hypothetical protein
MDVNNLSDLSKANSDEKIGQFWDEHDFTEFDNLEAPDVEFEVSCAVPIEETLFAAIEKQAQKRGVRVETLVNL